MTSSKERIEKLFGNNQDKDVMEIFHENDYEVKYKDLTIYPVEVALYKVFYMCVDSLLLPKNERNDIKFISMSYLEYISYLADKEHNEQPIINIIELFKMCFRLEDVLIVNGEIQQYKDGTPRPCVEFCFRDDNTAFLRIMDIEYDSTDFNNIKEIICRQNNIVLPDPLIHPDIMKEYNKVQEIKRKQSKMKMCGFGDQLCVVMGNTGFTKAELLKMTIRTFEKLFERITMQLNYELGTILSPNMEKKEQNAIKHYLADTTIDIFKEATTSYEGVKNKIN